MSANDFVIGVRTRLFFGLMPQSLLALDNPTPPPDVKVTLAAAIVAGDATITTTALSGPIAKGSAIRIAPGQIVTVGSGGAAADAVSLPVVALTAAIPAGSTLFFNGQTVVTAALASISATSITVEPISFALVAGELGYYQSGTPRTYFVTTDVAAAATSIPIEPAGFAMANASVGVHYGLVLLQGGTTSSEQLQAQDTETRVYGGKLPYSTGIVTGASWQVSYSFNVLPSDIGYTRLAYCAQYALDGARGWCKKQDPPPAGYTTGELIQGVADVTDFQKTNPAEGIITG